MSDLARRRRLLADLSAQQRDELEQLLLTALHPHAVMTLEEWARLNAIPYSSARALIAAGKGPKLVPISARRFGVRNCDNAKWQASRLQACA
jgi:hypothetical protein